MAFNGLGTLQTMVLIQGEERSGGLNVEIGGFDGLTSLELAYVDDHRICCFFIKTVDCTSLEKQSPLFSCGELMQNTFLRVSMWLLGTSAVFGNFFVFIWRLSERNLKREHFVQSFLVMNLAISDCMMGIYMLILAGYDLYFGKLYFQVADVWRGSLMCKFAGFLSLLSSEASVCLLVLITLDRLFGIVFPFSRLRLGRLSVKIIVCIIWVTMAILSLAPILLTDITTDFYGLSDVCIGLPLITQPTNYVIHQGGIQSSLTSHQFSIPVPQDSKPAWYFSIVLFLGLNLALFLIIMVCYIAMFIQVKVSSKTVHRNTERKDEIKMAIKMAIIVGTDFLCWMPIIIMGILSQTGAVVIPVSVYAWSAVLILPINSSINPYLYTISTLFTSKNSKKRPPPTTKKTPLTRSI
ncbi:G-protein coupled receptor GRL101-like [Amphiura filiformis]|uniref:G-protein coupled receptor GRL101-like n=1 Tax=Amphiura filiformis TaxID=82378 RepID=UPI003B221F0D